MVVPAAAAAGGLGVAKLLKAAGLLSTLVAVPPVLDYFSEDSVLEDLASKKPSSVTGKRNFGLLDKARFAISGAGKGKADDGTDLDIRGATRAAAKKGRELQLQRAIEDAEAGVKIKQAGLSDAEKYAEGLPKRKFDRLIDADKNALKESLARLGLEKQGLSNSLAVSLAELDLREQAQKREMERFYEMQRIAREDKQYERRKAMIYALSALGEIPFL